jgi:uncharacterized protein (UPF0262 family)
MSTHIASLVLDELRVDEALWLTGDDARRAEWRLLCNDVIEEGRFGWEAPSARLKRGIVSVAMAELRIEVMVDGKLTLTERVGMPALQPLVDEYINTCREMTKVGVSAPRMEALDIAKRISHDEAGEVVQHALTTLRPDHGTARRLFSLFVTLLHDTTKLNARPHTLHY